MEQKKEDSYAESCQNYEYKKVGMVWETQGRWHAEAKVHINILGDFWAIDILVFPSPTCYMLTSFSFPLVDWGIF